MFYEEANWERKVSDSLVMHFRRLTGYPCRFAQRNGSCDLEPVERENLTPPLVPSFEACASMKLSLRVPFEQAISHGDTLESFCKAWIHVTARM